MFACQTAKHRTGRGHQGKAGIANPDNEVAKRFCPQNARGIKPFMERIIFAMPPFCIIFIIFCICSN